MLLCPRICNSTSSTLARTHLLPALLLRRQRALELCRLPLRRLQGRAGGGGLPLQQLGTRAGGTGGTGQREGLDVG